MMKKYEYVKVTFGGFFSYKMDQHRSIIDDYARRGFRYAGYVPTKIVGYGTIQEIDLIFEIDVEDYAG